MLTPRQIRPQDAQTGQLARLDWATDDATALAVLAPDHQQRHQLRRVQHGAWAALRRTRDVWLTKNGHTLRELRRNGLVLFKAPY